MGAWYYFNSDGRMATGMIEVGGLRYYMDPPTVVWYLAEQ